MIITSTIPKIASQLTPETNFPAPLHARDLVMPEAPRQQAGGLQADAAAALAAGGESHHHPYRTVPSGFVEAHAPVKTHTLPTLIYSSLLPLLSPSYAVTASGF
jgi:hypothetical protein